MEIEKIWLKSRSNQSYWIARNKVVWIWTLKHVQPTILATRRDATVLPVEKEVFGQPLGSNDLENDLVGLEGLAVDPAGQGRMEALGQPFAYRQLLGNHLVFRIILQNLRKDTRNDQNEADNIILMFLSQMWINKIKHLFYWFFLTIFI